MDFLGYTFEKPAKAENGNWDMIDMEYPDDKMFNEATGKIIRGFKANNCRFIVADDDNTRYFVDILDVRYDVVKNVIKVWPHDCNIVKK